jgi:hypothetical protein
MKFFLREEDFHFGGGSDTIGMLGRVDSNSILTREAGDSGVLVRPFITPIPRGQDDSKTGSVFTLTS